MTQTQNNLPIKHEYSAGGPVYKQQTTDNRQPTTVWLLGKHSGYHKWVLPKGMIEPGEKAVETAVRETKEEMGVVARVVDNKPLHKDEYWFVASAKTNDQKPTANNNKPERRVGVYQEDEAFEKADNKVRVHKTVTFFLMEHVSGNPKDHGWEMEDCGWFEYSKALEMLSFEGEKQALTRAAKVLGLI